MGLSREVDRAIAADNRRIQATLCRKCAGTGTIYIPLNQMRTKHRRQTCDGCAGTGQR